MASRVSQLAIFISIRWLKCNAPLLMPTVRAERSVTQPAVRVSRCREQLKLLQRGGPQGLATNIAPDAGDEATRRRPGKVRGQHPATHPRSPAALCIGNVCNYARVKPVIRRCQTGFDLVTIL